MLTIGLTGGMGSGKSTVANFFAELGIDIIDADQIARELVLPTTPAWTAIVAHFGENILNSDNTLQRQKLRDIVFQQVERRVWLEQLLHPLIRQRMQQLIATASSAYVIAVIPLLMENLPNPLVQRILLVDAPEALQIQRVIVRDQLSANEIKQTLAAQMTRQQRLQLADDVIENHSDLNDLKQQVLALHQKYLQMVISDR